jgi:hypothetical protein
MGEPKGDTAKGRVGERAKRRWGERAWWGEAPALSLIFAKSLAGFGDIVREADSLPSRGPSVAHLQPRLGLIDRLLDVGESGVAARQRVRPIRDNLAADDHLCSNLQSAPEPRPTKMGFALCRVATSRQPRPSCR